MSATPSEIEALRAALAAAEARASAAEADAARARAVLSSSDAMIVALRLEIEKLRRALYGTKSERKARLLEQLELQLEELEAAATEDELAAERLATPAAAPSPSTERRRPVRKPFPAHLPRERVVVAAPETCTCCGSGRIVKLGEDGEPFVRHWSEENGERDAGGHSPAVEGDPDGAGEVHLPGLRADQSAAIRHRA